ncbi:Transcriptional regulator [Halomicronema hongdechloris C2206]|uniref:Transcriptional regulator n=1 Tax=Halomicronema hongdechloris C2206 TaxID=1641165 RepID=A0A1Z3HMC9_9CYAN|nr:metalloregulator ArsR/SmtB family transcription factor [Halomicronema hongdechloris]ASC71469.1 Transcriptional regulator [Halomicronema hongdechloris C2206]
MDTKDIFKVLANDTRLRILQWLKDPKAHFPNAENGVNETEGVCVGLIQKKSGLAQSTISHYLVMLEEAGLVKSTRQGQHTYYRRNNTALADLAHLVADEL